MGSSIETDSVGWDRFQSCRFDFQKVLEKKDLVCKLCSALLLYLFQLTTINSSHSYQWGVSEIHVVSVIASKQGLSELMKFHPDVHVTLGHIDEELNADGDVMPGLGDAGDRLFGTPLIEDEEELVHPSKRKRTMSVDDGN